MSWPHGKGPPSATARAVAQNTAVGVSPATFLLLLLQNGVNFNLYPYRRGGVLAEGLLSLFGASALVLVAELWNVLSMWFLIPMVFPMA
jgi:hypothetical protein